jgi:Na+/proline symporter
MFLLSSSTILLIIIVAYFILLLGVAFYTARGSNNESFFVGNRSSKWWLVAFGMIGTSLSGMTFISVPGTVGQGAFGYFQVVLGYWIGYFIVSYILLPVYYKMQLTSIYTYLEKRLGNGAHKTGAFFFILSRTLGATIRLYLVIKVLELFVLGNLGISFEITAIVILGLILLYTFKGGVKTIVWTDTLQTTFMLLALIVSIIFLLNNLNIGLTEAYAVMQQKAMTNVFATDVMKGNFFLKEIIGGMVITIAMTGLDQEMMQKNISVSNLKDSQKNMVVMGTLQMIVVFIFLFLGGLLYMYAIQNGAGYEEIVKDGIISKQIVWNGSVLKADDIFPQIAINSGLPFILTICFIVGLISALFPSADGALTALTSSFCIDILGMNKQKEAMESAGIAASTIEHKLSKKRLRVHYSFAVIFLLCVFFFREVDNGSLITLLLKLAGFTYGPLLGLFAFGLITKRTLKWEKSPLIICIIGMFFTLVLDIVNNYEWYIKQFGWSGELSNILQQWSINIFGGYKIGVELLLINAIFTFLILFINSKKLK